MGLSDLSGTPFRCRLSTVPETDFQEHRSGFVVPGLAGGEGGGTEIGKKEEQGRSRVVSEQIRWEKTEIRAAYVLYPLQF